VFTLFKEVENGESIKYYDRHFNITIKSTVQYFVNTHSGLVSCVKPIYFPTNLTTICYIKENESDGINIPGCAKCFARTTQNTMTECSMADLHQRTLDKNNFIADRGYKYISNWECDFDRQISGLVSCVKPIYFPTNLTTICYIKENESDGINIKDDMDVECGCCNIHI
jgi:hypothetical protein